MKNLHVGSFTYGQDDIQIFEWGEGASLFIGKYCSIASGLKVYLGGNHNLKRFTTYPFGHIFEDTFGDQKYTGHPLSNGDVKIGNDVWIGANSTIMSGVSVGDGAAIAANSHVIKDVKPYELVGGNPAQHIKYRFSEEVVNKLLEFKWWNYPAEQVKSLIPLLTSEVTLETLQIIEIKLKSLD